MQPESAPAFNAQLVEASEQAVEGLLQELRGAAEFELASSELSAFRRIVSTLENKDVYAATVCFANEVDKFRDYPEVLSVLQRNFGRFGQLSQQIRSIRE